jgi:hypothetical protein
MKQSSQLAWLLAILCFGPEDGLLAQAAARPLPAWEAALPVQGSSGSLGWAEAPRQIPQNNLAAGSQVRTGLLVGSIIGAAATTVFLIGFCSDADTECGADEVGRAVLFIGVPAAALGALVGSLIHKED